MGDIDFAKDEIKSGPRSVFMMFVTFSISIVGANIVLAIMIELWEKVNDREAIIDLYELNHMITDIELSMFWRRYTTNPSHLIYA